MSNNIINTAFICEEENIKPLSVAIVSMLENATDSTKYAITILSKAKYSKSKTKLLSSFKDKYDCEITLTKTDNVHKNDVKSISTLVTNALTNLDNCIYLDYNVIVQRDLTELYNFDLGDQAIGGVIDVEINEFSPSVLLIDCAKIRENENMDIGNIELKFNLRAGYFQGEKSFNFSPKVTVCKEVIDGFEKKQLREAFKENVIFSYTDEVNPFVAHDSSFVDEWYKYFCLSPLTTQEDIKTPLISVIVPVYNVEKYLELCVDSITNQSYKNLEIILVNDGSTDSSGQICDELASSDTRINVIQKENGGQGSSRNVGMNNSSGDYLTFVDSDDFIHPKTYCFAMCSFSETPDLDLVEWKAYASKECAVLDKKYTQVEFKRFRDYDSLQQNQEEFIKGTILRSPNSVNVWSKLFKSSFINNVKFPTDKFAEDLFFTTDYMTKVNKITVINLPLYHYLLRSDSTTNKLITQENLDEFRGFVERYSILKKNYSGYVEIACQKDLAFFYARMKEIVEQNQDKDMSVRKALVEIMLTYYDDIVKFDSISQNIKDDFILAKNDVVAFIEKHDVVFEKEILLLKSGRTIEALDQIVSKLNKDNFDVNLVDLLDKLFLTPYIDKITTIFNNNKIYFKQFNQITNKKFTPCNTNKNKIYFVTNNLFYIFRDKDKTLTKVDLRTKNELEILKTFNNNTLFFENLYNFSVLYHKKFSKNLECTNPNISEMIHLYYDNIEEFSLMLYKYDLKDIFRYRTINILIGENEKDMFLTNIDKPINNKVNILYYKDINLGDTLVPIIIKWMLDKHKLSMFEKTKNTSSLLSLGSVCGLEDDDVTIWGTGMHLLDTIVSMYNNKNKYKIDIRAVRGPVTKYYYNSMGYNCPEIYGDPAILMPLIYAPKNIVKKYEVSIIIHYGSAEYNKYKDVEGINFIDIKTYDYEFFINEILSSKKIISSALHGIILSESYSIPTVFLNTGGYVDKALMKYYDWYLSTQRGDFKIAKTLEEALQIEPSELPKLDDMRVNLMNSFPYDLWLGTKYKNDLEEVIICMACDENYAPYCGVAIESIISNCNSTRDYEINIFYTKLNKTTIKKLISLSTINVTIKIIDISIQIQDIKSCMQLNKNHHFTEEVYYRILIPEILKQHNKVLYLDCDIICLKDVGTLFDIDISNYTVGVVSGPAPIGLKEHYVKNQLIEQPLESYFNSGIMLFNIDMFIKLELQKKCYKILTKACENNVILLWVDQCVLNIVTNGTALEIDSRWNARSLLKDLSTREKPTKDQLIALEKSFKEQYIVHYASSNKPWLYPEIEWSNHFWKYANESIFYDEVFDKLLNHRVNLLLNNGNIFSKEECKKNLLKSINFVQK